MQKTKQVSFRIPAQLHKRLKVYASRRGKTIRQVILESLPFNKHYGAHYSAQQIRRIIQSR